MAQPRITSPSLGTVSLLIRNPTNFSCQVAAPGGDEALPFMVQGKLFARSSKRVISSIAFGDVVAPRHCHGLLKFVRWGSIRMGRRRADPKRIGFRQPRHILPGWELLEPVRVRVEPADDRGFKRPLVVEAWLIPIDPSLAERLQHGADVLVLVFDRTASAPCGLLQSPIVVGFVEGLPAVSLASMAK